MNCLINQKEKKKKVEGEKETEGVLPLSAIFFNWVMREWNEVDDR